MSDLFFDKMKNALRTYLTDELEIEIVDLVEVDNPNGQTVNTLEPWCYRVRMVNRGPVTIENAVVEVAALNGTTVSTSPDDGWTDSVLSEPMTIGSGRAKKTQPLYFKAPATPGPMELVEATVMSWDADLGGMLNRHSIGSDTPSAVFSTNVEVPND